MTEFNLVPEFAGVDTSDLLRSYNPNEQMAIIHALFGAISPQGPLVLPSSEVLNIGRRLGRNTRYLIGASRDDQSPSLFVPRNDGRKPMPLIEATKKDGEESSRGLLPKVTRRLLALGRHVLEETVKGEEMEFDALPKDKDMAGRRLGDFVICDALLGSDDWDAVIAPVESLDSDIEKFLGDELFEAEMLERRTHRFNWEERPFENFILDLSDRISALRQPE